MAPAFHSTSLASVPVTVPVSWHNNGAILQYALIFETVANLIGVSGFLYYATAIPAAISAAPAPSNPIAARFMAAAAGPLSVTPFTVETVAGFIAALTVPIILCIPNTKRAIESRPTVYATLLAGEIILCAQLVAEATTGRSGLDANKCWFMVGNLIPFALWRVFVLAVRPEWMGSYKEVTHAKKS